jgi:hypothetical protein
MRTGTRVVWGVLVWIVLMGIVVVGFVCGARYGEGRVGAVLCSLVALVLVQLITALLPLSLRCSPVGAEPTQAIRRTWADRLVGALHLGGPGEAGADLARLDAGVQLFVLAYGPHDGTQITGRLLLRRLPDGTVDAAWRPRKSRVAVPLAQSPAFAVNEGAVQQGKVPIRFGMTSSIELGGCSYWVRPVDADLLRMVFASETAVSVTA